MNTQQTPEVGATPRCHPSPSTPQLQPLSGSVLPQLPMVSGTAWGQQHPMGTLPSSLPSPVLLALLPSRGRTPQLHTNAHSPEVAQCEMALPPTAPCPAQRRGKPSTYQNSIYSKRLEVFFFSPLPLFLNQPKYFTFSLKKFNVSHCTAPRLLTSPKHTQLPSPYCYNLNV